MSTPRDRLVLVLDVDDPRHALELAGRLEPWFGIAKVGYELYAAAGPDVFDRLHDLGFRVFADLKLHDIPTTVERAARVLGRRGVEFVNFHAAGGARMLQVGAAGLRAGAHEAGHDAPLALAVTVLTSEHDVGVFPARLAAAVEGGCDGVVCAASEIVPARAAAMRTMVPGIRLSGDDVHDQARVSTPRDALAAGADWLVVGRAVTAAIDPEDAAARVTASAAEGLATA